MLYKRKDKHGNPFGNYYTKFTLYTESVHRSTGTKNKPLAQEFEDQIRADIHRRKKMGGTPVYRWQDAVTKYINHHLHNRTIDEDKRYYKWLEPYLLDKLLDAGLPNGINSEVIEGIKEAKLSEGVSNLTVNRLLEIVRKTLYYAKTIKMVVDVVAIEMLPYKKRAKRWETEDNMNKLLQDLIEHKADHIHEMVDFTLETGLRESNVTGFQKSWVDFNLRQATIPADESKNQDEITIPLSDRAIVIIRRNWNNKHPTHVFTYKGKEPKDPTSDAYKRWKERKTNASK